MTPFIERSELRQEHFKRFPMAYYEDNMKRVILYGAIIPKSDKISYIVVATKKDEHGPAKTQEVPVVNLLEAISYYNNYVK